MKITLDTNIIFQAIYSNQGASHQILKMIRKEKLKLALSIPVFKEYCTVLSRPSTLEQTRLNIKQINSVLDFLAYAGYYAKIYFLLRPNLRDENDNIFLELAFASNSKYLITCNIKHFQQSNLIFDDFQIITPGDFLKERGELN